jgi:hypothetical protein
MRQAYEEEKRRYVLAIRLKDQAFERIVSPSHGGAVSFRTPVVQGLIGDLGRVLESEDRLVALWASFRTERLAFYRDLGALPYDNWDAFYDDLAARHGAFGDIRAAPPATPAPPSQAPER